MGARVEVDGLPQLLNGLRGVEARDINRELRSVARTIASDMLLPAVVDAVSRGQAPQSQAMAKTARVVSDRVPVVALGRVSPRFNHKWLRKGESAATRRLRRGSMARGVVVGPLGGHKDTGAQENYYRTSRDPSGGPLGRALRDGGPILDGGKKAYLDAYTAALKRHGFDAKTRAH